MTHGPRSRLVTEEPATSTSLDRMVGPNRDLALIRSNLDDVKAVGHALDATVNDVPGHCGQGASPPSRSGRAGRRHDGADLRPGLSRRDDWSATGNLIAQMAIPSI